MTRVLPKPDLRSKNMDISESIFRDPKELEALKAKVKPEVYLATVYEKIFSKEKEYDALEGRFIEKQNVLVVKFEDSKKILTTELSVLENHIAIRQKDKDELDKPFKDRTEELNEREEILQKNIALVDEREQRVLEQERAVESKLESVQDLSSQLGETHIAQMVKAKTLAGREKILKENETGLLLKISNFNDFVGSEKLNLLKKEEDIVLRELNIQSKEENLIAREKILSDGHIWLDDQRGVLARAWAELRNKKR